MKLFVDDEREPLEPGWEVRRDALGAFMAINLHAAGNLEYQIEQLSLDHDLGHDTLSGYDVAQNLEEKVLQGECLPPFILRVHSGNSVGVQKILQAFYSIARYCEREGLNVPTIMRVQPLDVCKPLS